MNRPDWGGEAAPGDWRPCPFCREFHSPAEPDEAEDGTEDAE